MLPSPSRKAFECVRARALLKCSVARDLNHAIVQRAGLDIPAYDSALQNLRRHARVALHFHPERLTRTGISVAEGLLASGIYKNQFETGLSSGSPSAFKGGERDQWEHHLFGGAYHGTDVSVSIRPKYGALDLMSHPDGPAPRFGSCYFLLRPAVLLRCSFTFNGSQEPQAGEHSGTLSTLDPVLAPLLVQLEQGSGALGVTRLNVAGFLDRLRNHLALPFENSASRPLGRALDSFIEVQVHGEIRLEQDVERLVADPAFQNHAVGQLLATISARYGIPLSWHPGFSLPVHQVPDYFRDYPVRALAERIADQGLLDAANIGAMANSVQREPQAWQTWAASDDTLTQFRRLWHVLVLRGVPRQIP